MAEENERYKDILKAFRQFPKKDRTKIAVELMAEEVAKIIEKKVKYLKKEQIYKMTEDLVEKLLIATEKCIDKELEKL